MVRGGVVFLWGILMGRLMGMGCGWVLKISGKLMMLVVISMVVLMRWWWVCMCSICMLLVVDVLVLDLVGFLGVVVVMELLCLRKENRFIGGVWFSGGWEVGV